MSRSMHQASVAPLARMMKNLLAIIAKAEADAAARNYDPQILLQARLAPDMHPLIRQFQMVSDSAKFAAARLTGQTPPAYPDTETNFAEIKDRLQRTIDYIESVDPAAFEGAEDREVVLKFPGGEFKFTGADYLANFVLPNFYFHATTAYAILRHNGVVLGKRDFLGA